MLKLYKRVRHVLHYHEAWVNGTTVIEHWGKAGDRGQTAEHEWNSALGEAENIELVLAKPLADGYEPIPEEDHSILIIEYRVDGMGTEEDLETRHLLQDRFDQTLGWTGLGHCDGGSIGSGSMEVCCIVVDYPIARRVIMKDLEGSPFAKYSRIYEEGADGDDDPADRADATPSAAVVGSGMLVPPWVVHPAIPLGDPAWQSGKPAEYLARWTSWYNALAVEFRSGYQQLFPAPEWWRLLDT